MAKPARSATLRKPSQRIAKQRAVREDQSGDESGEGETPNPRDDRLRRSTYSDAVAIYEQALRTLQQHNYGKAAELLRHVIASFPEERELLERSRLYVALCDRQLRPTAGEPGDTDERLYAATLSLNAGDPDRAIGYLNRVNEEDPSNDRALYMLAVAHAQRGEPRVAIPYLAQAIEANPENRCLARVDPDLERLRGVAGVSALLESSAARFQRAKRVARRR